MKVAIGFQIQDGPWGGGNRFIKSLSQALLAQGHHVVTTLVDADIDIILMVDPRWRHPNLTFSSGAVLRYLLFRNPRALVVHRINECDERKNTRNMNGKLKTVNYCADHTVFVGRWLQDLDLWQRSSRASVITNGADPATFNPLGWSRWEGRGPLRLVTHHWGGNWMKGFDIYSRVDKMLDQPEWRGRIEFTYVGNLPSGFCFANAKHVAPLDGQALADELKRHHGYLTASINEPGGNHQNEGALCGLPLLYRDSGCMPEYCDGFGVCFTPETFENSLTCYIDEYDHWADQMPNYPHTSGRTTQKYVALFERMLDDRESFLKKRQLWRKPSAVFRNQLPL
ncbi:hypothetical protein [Nitrogeniibacter aestuarii]|uniref:hypothetical protein n=1 Tax=Nitrogeniibacter aestuarii TaxID=2815343 RepID=UPI001D0FF083|nr:hypothetical protein [Nitrogeniibacter aestuarii]